MSPLSSPLSYTSNESPSSSTAILDSIIIPNNPRPAATVSQCPEDDRNKSGDDIGTPLSTATSSSYSPHQSSLFYESNSLKSRKQDGSSCSTEAGTSEDDEDELNNGERGLLVSLSTPRNGTIVGSSRCPAGLDPRIVTTDIQTSLTRQSISTYHQRHILATDIVKTKGSSTSLTRKSQQSQHSTSGLCRTPKSGILYRHHQPTTSSSSSSILKKSSNNMTLQPCHHHHRNAVSKTRKDSPPPTMGSNGRRLSFSKPSSSATTADRQMKLFSRSETLILFDWDDTLLPSSWLAERQLTLDPSNVPSEQEKAYLEAVGNTVCSLLIAAVHCGRVVVVTNAESGWVDLSAAKFMPKVLDTLNFWHISVISARSEFESAELQHPVQWKIHAFRHLLLLAYPSSHHDEQASSSCHKTQNKDAGMKRQKSCSSSQRCPSSPPNQEQPFWIDGSRPPGESGRKNVVSFGDSDSERIALIQCVKSMASGEAMNHSSQQKSNESDALSSPQLSLYKSFKLCEHPTPTILQRQLQLVMKLLPQIVHHSSNLDLRVNFKMTR